ncbi:MAG TPA: hypothetical protein VLV82_01190 [Candidatus Angelobacter sp.]|nr:hypothetical protein [Candidatus Angelobacter sp.]
MSTATIVLCPALPGSEPTYDAADVVDVVLDDPRAAGIRAMSLDVPDPEPGDDRRTARAHWVAHLAVGLAARSATAPVLLVLGGESGAMAAAVGFSQRAARRAVSGYVLVDAAVPPAESRGGDWPDAPVSYIASPAADPLAVNQARLRGWDVREVADTTPATVGAAVAEIATG